LNFKSNFPGFFFSESVESKKVFDFAAGNDLDMIIVGNIHQLIRRWSMTLTVTELYEAAMALSEEDRAELTEHLVASLPATNGLHPSWRAELHRRADEVASGKVQLIPADEVFQEVFKRLELRKANG
jgi:putative addiction module component (TIGR02574 family)